MAFYRNANYNNYIRKVRINLGDVMHLEKEDEAFIELKELSTIETMQLKEAFDKGEVELMTFFKKVLPGIILDHNFYEAENKRMSNEALTNLLFESIEASGKVIDRYSDEVFSSQGKKKEDK